MRREPAKLCVGANRPFLNIVLALAKRNLEAQLSQLFTMFAGLGLEHQP